MWKKNFVTETSVLVYKDLEKCYMTNSSLFNEQVKVSQQMIYG